MSAKATVAYLDSSALVKLVVAEPESSALRRHLKSRPIRVSCALARVEVIRAVRGHGRQATALARRVLARTRLLSLDDTLLDAAASLDGGVLRSLDAIHLAAARTFGALLREVVTYDARMTTAATSLGLATAAPA
ncbi:MAG TPA: type II toxin-antitoxin system VapC family toxin [Planctomycetota bacterium]|nr:type II toxin-antitoxin system VapC family toxin [Planctomycetota bacterium]